MNNRTVVLLIAIALAPTACDKTGAYGDMDSIIVGTSTEIWEQIGDSVYSTLEPRVFTVRREPAFTVFFQDATHPDWRNLREFKQELLVGRATDPWMLDAVAQLDPATLSPPQVLQTYNVWARGQNVTLVLLSDDGGPEEVFGLLNELHALYDEQFREFATARMFVSGRDTALADTLARTAGFSLLVPQVYYWDRQDSVFLFRNDNPDPSELIRQIMITWRAPAGEELLEREAILSWREEVAATYYGTPQNVDLSVVEEGLSLRDGRDVYQVQAVWANPPEMDWPAGGPFISRAVWCPTQERVYLLDAWLYAPGKPKYEYMIQLETILNSFLCGMEG